MSVVSPIQDEQDSKNYKPSDTEMRDALKRIINSDAFVSAPRLQQILSYVVEETVAGRGAAIKSKAIAIDVYGRQSDDIEAGQNVVRVEARRLRRQLNEYYAESGKDDPWRIRIDLGGYSPRFESATETNASEQLTPLQAEGPPSRTKIVLATAVALLALPVLGAYFFSHSTTPELDGLTDDALYAAYRERSVPALQAVNLAEQTRGMFFPLFDRKRQELALEMFRHVIELDPGLHHGYAGAAQVLATLAIISPDRNLAAEFREDALSMAEMAIELSPSDAWAHAANGWARAVSGDLDKSLSHARIAADLAPQNGHILDLAGLTAIIINAPELAAEATDPNRYRSGIGRFGANSIWGVSQFMLGNYSATIDSFTAALKSGAPVSAPTLIMLAAAYDHVGDVEKAERTFAELIETWPNFPISLVVGRFFANAPIHEHDILERLAKYGYQE